MSQVGAYYPAATMREFASEPNHDHVKHGHLSIAPSEHANLTHAPAIVTTNTLNLPDSQESIQSTALSIFSAPALPSSSSNLSSLADTEFTSPSSTNVASNQRKAAEALMPISPKPPRDADMQASGPRVDTAAANALRTGDTAASPMLLDSPVSHGSKRTADGLVKSIGLGIDGTATHTAAHKRNKSMDTHSETRIGKLSGKLKTRLSYAMVKVQNGWEKQSLEELEEVHSQRGSPNSAPGRSDRLVFDSPYPGHRQRRPSGVSENSDRMIMSPESDPVRSLAATPYSYWRPGSKPAMNAAASLISITGAQPGFGLAPAPDIQAGRRRSASGSHAPPPLLGTAQRKHFSDLGAGLRTPVTPRAGILRMPSQQAEKDAVDTLLFMSSPNNSQRFPHTSQAAPSPLRAEAPQRRVMFEAYPQQEKRVVYQPPMPAPPHHQQGPYPAYPAR